MSYNVQKLIEEALSWLGTPYHQQAAVKGPKGGVDCAMFLVKVFVNSGILPSFDPRPYSNTFFLHRGEPLYLGWVEKYGKKVDEGIPGDVALFKIGRGIGHGGIYLGDDTIIHAWQQAGYVTKSELQRSPMLAQRFEGFWRLL